MTRFTRIAFSLVLGASSACSFLVDTTGFIGGADVPEAAAPDVADSADVGSPIEASTIIDATSEDARPKPPCNDLPIPVAKDAESDGGFAWIVSMSYGTTPDSSGDNERSTLRLFEDGVELKPAHAAHVDIRNIGLGRFSHWITIGTTDESIRFSASDNSNPKTNGRSYTYCTQ